MVLGILQSGGGGALGAFQNGMPGMSGMANGVQPMGGLQAAGMRL
jgi:hypothetical protein